MNCYRYTLFCESGNEYLLTGYSPKNPPRRGSKSGRSTMKSGGLSASVFLAANKIIGQKSIGE
jgi:hypothetical protein